MSHIKLPHISDDSKILPDREFVDIYARMKGVLMVGTTFDESQTVTLSTDSTTDTHAALEKTLNMIVDKYGLPKLMYFLAHMMLRELGHNQQDFLKRYGAVVKDMSAKYDHWDLGYAISMIQSIDSMGLDVVMGMIEENTHLSRDDATAVYESLEKMRILSILLSRVLNPDVSMEADVDDDEYT